MGVTDTVAVGGVRRERLRLLVTLTYTLRLVEHMDLGCCNSHYAEENFRTPGQMRRGVAA